MNRTESLPMVALRGMTILPEMVAHFDISRERSIEAVQEAMASNQKIFLLTQKDVDMYIDQAEDIDVLFEEVIEELKKHNATKAKMTEMQKLMEATLEK